MHNWNILGMFFSYFLIRLFSELPENIFLYNVEELLWHIKHMLRRIKFLSSIFSWFSISFLLFTVLTSPINRELQLFYLLIFLAAVCNVWAKVFDIFCSFKSFDNFFFYNLHMFETCLTDYDKLQTVNPKQTKNKVETFA